MPRLPDDDLIAARVFSHYRQIGVIPGWDRERFIRLCSLANRTAEEIGAMAGMLPFKTRTALEKGRFSPAESLHFATIEAVIKERNFGEPWEPLMPLDLIQK